MNSLCRLSLQQRFSRNPFTPLFLTGAFGFAAARWAFAAPPVPYPLLAQAGTPAEQNLVIKNAGSVMLGEFRHADKGQFWIYGFPVAPGSRCALTLTLDTSADTTPPTAAVLGADNKPLAIHTEIAQNLYTVVWTVPSKWPVGNRISVMLSAKDGATAVKGLQLTQTLPDSNGDGVPDVVRLLLTTGLPSSSRLNVVRPPTQPYTVTASDQSVTPALDAQTDAIFADTTDPAIINGWKTRGYTVWSRGNSSVSDAFAQQNREAIQTLRDGKPVQGKLGNGKTFTPSEQNWASAAPFVLARDRSLFDAALRAGSDGACFLEPGYFAAAGYEPAFKQAWQTEYRAPWLDPISGIEARYHASRLMAQSIAARTQSAMQGIASNKPNARRMVAVQSLLHGAERGIISPITRIAGLNEVSDVIADVDADTTLSPIRYAGLRQEMTFDRAYLEYSSIFHAARGANKRVWFQVSPPLNDLLAPTDLRADFEQRLIASLLLPDVNAYQLTLPAQTLTSTLTTDEQIRQQSLLNALEDMHNQTGISGNADKDDTIGVLISDSIQWQRGGPGASDLDGVFGLALPLLQRGIPVQMVSLDRAADPGYLNGFKTLLVSYDFQKPLGMRTQQALAEWIRRGGSLIYVGGTDAYNGITDSWWQQAGFVAPQMDLWKQFGLNLGAPSPRMAPSEDASRYTTLLTSEDRPAPARHTHTLDLTRFAASTGSVAIRFFSHNADSVNGISVASGELSVGGKTAASFTTGSEIENRFLVYDNNSRFSPTGRLATGNASWTYQFDNLPPDVPITLALDIAGSYTISAFSARPDFGHTLLSTGANVPLSKAFPRLRIGASYPATLYEGAEEKEKRRKGEKETRNASSAIGNPESVMDLSLIPHPSSLYTLRAGGAPIWTQNIGRGLVLNVGVAPGFFSASERSAGLLRALTRFAQQRAGGTYREPGFLRLQRGRYTIVHTFSEALTVEGRMIDLLSPTLNTADDRVIAPNSSALLYDLGSPDAEPHVGFVSGRLQARVETATTTGFFVRGAAGTTGSARLHRGNRRLIGARGMDWLGRPISVQAQEDGGTLLLRYPNHPDGVIIRVGWQ